MKNKDLYLNSRDELFRIRTDSIVFFESDGNYTNIILANKFKGSVCMNLAQMQNVLSENLKEQASIYVRIGKRYIVNLNYVCQIQVLRQKLLLSDGYTFTFALDISKEALKKLKDLYVKAAMK